MSNATDTPRKSGQRRRRRSRGGNNRNQGPNQNQNQNRNQGEHSRPQGSSNGSGRSRRRRPERKPVKLTFWQKLLKALGLYNPQSQHKGRNDKFAHSQTDKSVRTQAERAPRSESDKSARPPEDKSARPPGDKSARPPKSNTRNARGRDGGADFDDRGGSRDNRRRGGDPSTVESSRVYVGNLSYDVTEQDLKELFKGVGNVRNVEIVYNRNTHRSKGYGFVEMMNREDAVRSVEVLHDQPFMGRNMTVSGAKNKGDGDDEDYESTMEIKASNVALAPLPHQSASEAQATSSTEAAGAAEVETPQLTEPVAETAAEPEAQQQEPKQD